MPRYVEEFLARLVSFKAKSGDSRRWIVAHPLRQEEFRSGNLDAVAVGNT